VYLDTATFDRLEEQSHQWSTKRLKHLAQRASKAGARVTTTLRDGDPVTQIVRAARSTRADLIAVGTHGRGAIPKFFLGSVAERVVKMSPCPVLTIRGTSTAR
jgi:nucleotide-binding universal stress UspA family protein